MFGALGFMMFGWAPSGWFFLGAICLNSLWALAAPPSLSLMTQRVSSSEQGKLQGALGSLRGVAMVIGPSMFSAVFAVGLTLQSPFPGAPWFLASFLLISALVVAFAAAPKRELVKSGPSKLAPAEQA
jgi:MFS transporter, DHA1 family, tetracycline resistance protein